MSSIGDYRIRIKPEVLAKEIEHDIERVVDAYRLDKREVYGDGFDLHEAKGMPLDTFKLLSDGDSKITRDDLARFTNTEQTLLQRFMSQIKNVLLPSIIEKVFPKQQMIEKLDPKTTRETVYEAKAYLATDVKLGERELLIHSDRSLPVEATITETRGNQKRQEIAAVDSEEYVKNISRKPEVTLNKVVPRQLDRTMGSDPTAANLYRYVGGEDQDGNGKLDVPREVSSSKLVQTAEDAFLLSGTDGAADPKEALHFVLKKNGVDTSMIDIEYVPTPPRPPQP